jgi:MFS transporter, DHA2 family, multidrug resistance protein
LAGHFGYKRFLIWNTALFAMTSVGAPLSPALGIMLIFRAVEGLAGAGLTVWWRAEIYMIMPKEKRGSSMMTTSVSLYFASIAGLILSGFLTDRLNWRLICVPNMILAFAAIRLLKNNFPELSKADSPRLQHTDYRGLILAAIGFLSLQVILSRGHIDDWFGSPHIRLLAVISLTALVAFACWERSANNRFPLMDISLLSNRYTLAAVFIGIFAGMILSGSLFVLPQFLRLVDTQTHSATQTGCLIAFYALAGAVLRPIMSKVIKKTGPRKTTALAFCMLIVAMLLFYRCLTTSTPDAYLLLPLALYAGCLTTVLPAIGQGAVGKLDPGRQLDGVQIYMTFRQLGASLGIAFLTILLERRETLHSSRLYEHLNAAKPNNLNCVEFNVQFSLHKQRRKHQSNKFNVCRFTCTSWGATGCNSELRRLLPLYGNGRRSRILFYSSTGSICRRSEASQTTSSESDRGGNAADLKGNVHPSASFGELMPTLAYISF